MMHNIVKHPIRNTLGILADARINPEADGTGISIPPHFDVVLL